MYTPLRTVVQLKRKEGRRNVAAATIRRLPQPDNNSHVLRIESPSDIKAALRQMRA